MTSLVRLLRLRDNPTTGYAMSAIKEKNINGKIIQSQVKRIQKAYNLSVSEDQRNCLKSFKKVDCKLETETVLGSEAFHVL